MPESPNDRPNDEWIQNTLVDSPTCLIKTGSKQGEQRAMAALAVLRDLRPPRVRAGRSPAVINLGGQMVCIDYSSQPVAVGDLAWIIVDFGESMPLGDKCAWHYQKERRANEANARCYA